MAKTYIQDAINIEINKALNKKMSSKEIEKLRNKLYAMILGNESKYKNQVDEAVNEIILKNNNITKVNCYNSIPSKSKLKKSYNRGKAVGISVALMALITTVAVSCGKNNSDENENESLKQKKVEISKELDIDEKQIKAEEIINSFVKNIEKNTTLAINSLLTNGVKMIDNYTLEESQKQLIAGEWLQYYLVANIDEITTLEYANFIKEQPGNIVDNDDLIYNFRNLNVLLKNQLLVCTPENKINFSDLYQNEFDASLLNGGVEILARLNSATTNADKKNISKEFYDYIQNTILNQSDKLKYSNSAMSTFINTEFGAWCEITKNSNYGRGYYPDDELEAKMMTVVSNCGLSKGEKSTLVIEDETKKSLESINVIRVLESLNSRKENISSLFITDELFYVDEASYGQLKSNVSKDIVLSNYKEIMSFEEKKEQQLINTKPQINKNDSKVSNNKGGTIAKDDMINNGINPSDANAREEYEKSVEENYEGETKVVNSSGQEIDEEQAAAWAQQGAIDANNGERNYNVPPLYQDAYDKGWNAANDALKNIDSIEDETSFEEVENKETETIVEEKHDDFKEPNNDSKVDNSSNIEEKTEFVPVDDKKSEITVEEKYDDFKESNNDLESNNSSDIEEKTEFVPVENGEQLIEETPETTIDFVEVSSTNENQNEIKNQKLESYIELKQLLQQAMINYQDAINIYDGMNYSDNSSKIM